MSTPPRPVTTAPSAGTPVAVSALAAMLLRLLARQPVEAKKTETTKA